MLREKKNLENDTEKLQKTKGMTPRKKEVITISRMSEKRKQEWAFFLNDRNRITYCDKCRKCQEECKQSYRAVIVACPKYHSKRALGD